MGKTPFMAVLLLGMGIASASSLYPSWEFGWESMMAAGSFQSPGGRLDYYEVKSGEVVIASDPYVSWYVPQEGDLSGSSANPMIASQTFGGWFNLDSGSGEPVQLLSFGTVSSANTGLLLTYDAASHSLELAKPGSGDESWSCSLGNMDTYDGGWFHLAYTIERTGARNALVTLFVNGVALGQGGINGGLEDKTHLLSGMTCLNPGAGEGFLVSDFKAYDEVLSADQIREAWSLVPEPSSVSLGLLGLATLMMRRRRFCAMYHAGLLLPLFKER